MHTDKTGYIIFLVTNLIVLLQWGQGWRRGRRAGLGSSGDGTWEFVIGFFSDLKTFPSKVIIPSMYLLSIYFSSSHMSFHNSGLRNKITSLLRSSTCPGVSSCAIPVAKSASITDHLRSGCVVSPRLLTKKLLKGPLWWHGCSSDPVTALVVALSRRGGSLFVYRDGAGWPALLPCIRKIRVSMLIGTQSGIRLHERVPMVKIWGSSKYDQNWTTGKLLNFEKFIFTILHLPLVVVLLLLLLQF